MSSNETLIRPIEGGANQSGLRDRNARVVLSHLRLHGALSSAEIARRSKLSAQTVSNIIRALEADGLLTRGEAIKGKVGKPSVPVALKPDGVLSLGLNIGRRAAELVLVDFNGSVIETVSTTYSYPEIENVFSFLERGIKRILGPHPEAQSRLAGIGVARPNEIWSWLELVKAPQASMEKWRSLDLTEAVEQRTGLDVVIENDATSACVAEQLLRHESSHRHFCYIFIGAFVGGGLVLDGKVHFGASRNAGALAPIPVPDGFGGTTQLLNVASLYTLEDALAAAGIDPKRLRDEIDDWTPFESWLEPWIETAARNLAIAVAAIAAVVEVEAVLIDGAMPEAVRRRVTDRTRELFARHDLTGIERPVIEEGKVGRTARSVGAALLPIHSKYFLA